MGFSNQIGVAKILSIPLRLAPYHRYTLVSNLQP